MVGSTPWSFGDGGNVPLARGTGLVRTLWSFGDGGNVPLARGTGLVRAVTGGLSMVGSTPWSFGDGGNVPLARGTGLVRVIPTGEYTLGIIVELLVRGTLLFAGLTDSRVPVGVVVTRGPMYSVIRFVKFRNRPLVLFPSTDTGELSSGVPSVFSKTISFSVFTKSNSSNSGTISVFRWLMLAICPVSDAFSLISSACV